MKILLNISLFSYLDRPIFDVTMNGTDFMGSPAHGFYGANSVMVMQSIELGSQFVSWRLDGPKGMPGNGDTVSALNCPILDAVPRDVKWLGLHIYPDNTVEIKLSRGTSTELQTQRGIDIINKWESQRHGA